MCALELPVCTGAIGKTTMAFTVIKFYSAQSRQVLGVLKSRNIRRAKPKIRHLMVIIMLIIAANHHGVRVGIQHAIIDNRPSQPRNIPKITTLLGSSERRSRRGRGLVNVRGSHVVRILQAAWHHLAARHLRGLMWWHVVIIVHNTSVCQATCLIDDLFCKWGMKAYSNCDIGTHRVMHTNNHNFFRVISNVYNLHFQNLLLAL